ncbi:unnamed protein product, partial [Mesorhabditis belari]|uniref:Uncharacterized protein n=1 Tax=Mesorhabditis belari TaxID=2138241 RepID=A0AAF3FGL7_9BILA
MKFFFLILLLVSIALFEVTTGGPVPNKETVTHDRARRQFDFGGSFPGVMQSSMNSWGSYFSQKQGGFNRQDNMLMLG